MIEVLHIIDDRQDELKANLDRDHEKIRIAVKKACKTLNRLTPDGAIHASGWIMTDLIRSLGLGEEQSIELLRIVQRRIENDLRIHAQVDRSSLN